MAETPRTQIMIGRAIYVVLALTIIFIRLLPLNTLPSVWAAPDILLLVTVVWVARRPDYAPVIVIAGIFVLTDFLFQRPPGLWAALVVILTEMIRARAGRIRDMPLALEWGSIAFGIAGITLLNRLTLMIVMTPLPPLALTLTQVVATILVYPVVALIAHYTFGVARPAPGQTNSLGHRL